LSPYLRVLSALGQRVKRKQGRGVMANCPAHEDDKISLSVAAAEDDGTVLIKCFAGCESSSIVEALGLRWSDLFPEKEENGKLDIQEVYQYKDENGKTLYEVVRLMPKGFRQRVPVGNSHRWSLGSVRRVLYRLPEILAEPGRAVWIVEGEKDSEALAKLGMIATTSAGGASGWRDDLREPLRGRHIIVVPDNDDPGYAYAETVSLSLHGIAASVRIVSLPGLAPKQDVSDWLAKGGTRKALEELAKATEPETAVLSLKDVAKILKEMQNRISRLEAANGGQGRID
jgi:DNA primase